MSKRILLGVIAADCHISFQSEILRGIISQSFRSNCDTAILAPIHNFSLTSLHKDTENRFLNSFSQTGQTDSSMTGIPYRMKT